jgi:hypothetical protein
MIDLYTSLHFSISKFLTITTVENKSINQSINQSILEFIHSFFCVVVEIGKVEGMFTTLLHFQRFLNMSFEIEYALRKV